MIGERLPKVLPIRLTEEMFADIRTEAKRLKVRPHDVARTALGIGLRAILESERAVKEVIYEQADV